MRKNFVWLGALVVMAGCSGGTSNLTGPAVTAAQLQAVPRSVTVLGKTLVGQTSVWRDMMPTVTLPGQPAANHGIIVSITIKADDNSALPGGLQAEKISVVRGTDVWTSTAVEVQRDSVSFGATVRNGPEWDGNTPVDVVADFKDTSGGTYQVRATGIVVLNAF